MLHAIFGLFAMWFFAMAVVNVITMRVGLALWCLMLFLGCGLAAMLYGEGAMTPEGRIKAKVKRAMASLPRCYRFMPVQNGMGAPSLDFINCIQGIFVAIETKTPGKQLTDRQKATAISIREAGGDVFVIRDDQDIRDMMSCVQHLSDCDIPAIYDKLWDGTDGPASVDKTA